MNPGNLIGNSHRKNKSVTFFEKASNPLSMVCVIMGNNYYVSTFTFCGFSEKLRKLISIDTSINKDAPVTPFEEECITNRHGYCYKTSHLAFSPPYGLLVMSVLTPAISRAKYEPRLNGFVGP